MSIKSKITRFWYSHNNIIARLMMPLGYFYSKVGEGRIRFTTPLQQKTLVVCVGNFVVGGAGKTPLAIAVIERLKRTSLKTCVLTRGYLGKEKGPLFVDLETHSSADVGDEALILAAHAPTIVSKDRRAGYQMATQQGFDIVVMDDGFQNPTVYKDISLVAMDAGAGVGNGLVFPAGPLRMRLRTQLPMSSVIVTIGDGFGGETVVQRAYRQHNIPRFKSFYEPHRLIKRYVGRKVIAFCGIGRPEKFVETLEDAGVIVVEKHYYPDHHVYTDQEAQMLLKQAADQNLPLLTTEKDLVRLPNSNTKTGELKKRATAIKITLTFDETMEFNKFLKEKLSGAFQHKKKLANQSLQPNPIQQQTKLQEKASGSNSQTK